MRAKNAASGMRPAASSRSTHASRRPTRSWHRKATFRRPAASALPTSAARPAALPCALCSSSRPLKSLAFSRHSSATCAGRSACSPLRPRHCCLSLSCSGRPHCRAQQQPPVRIAGLHQALLRPPVQPTAHRISASRLLQWVDARPAPHAVASLASTLRARPLDSCPTLYPAGCWAGGACSSPTDSASSPSPTALQVSW